VSPLAIDHLVIGARTLDEGVAWCEATLGVAPTGGGKHALMGTHNRVMSIASPAAPKAYLEVIAIDPQAPDPGRSRWFDLDSPAMQASLGRGPRLIHWVARCDDIDARCARLREAAIERGEVLDAQRQTDRGLLRWRITVRPDGGRLFDGALPTLIQWNGEHPVEGMSDSGVELQRLEVGALPTDAQAACAAPGMRFTSGPPALKAILSTPKGEIHLTTR
jgi:hypothetical protein